MILVTGATGNVGRQVVSLLLDEGAPVRALTRTPAAAELPAAAEVVGGDLARPQDRASALAGISSLFLNPAAIGSAAVPFLAVAREQGVRRVVLLSSASVEDGVAEQHGPIAVLHKRIEDAVEASGLEWTFIRPGEFAANALVQYGPQIRATGVVRGAYGEAAMAPIHERDIAAVAVRALLSDGHLGARYRLTGPESLTQYDKVRLIGEAIGREVRFQEAPPEEALKALVARGVPADSAEVLLGYQAAAVGREAPVSPAVLEITGRPGLTFAAWAADHADAFRA
ncbi:NAD(P)H-binding protein [Peterkaempfera bronchialis]|uniref:NAD(P)H-binding protein n=1 Tax=Peterkaempfera bronchialis TaxID=2126346 RepID=UPI003C2D5677